MIHIKRLISCSSVVVCLFVGVVFGLGYEDFGERPIEVSKGWPDGLLETLESQKRVYRQWVNGGEFFFYNGDTKAFNKFLKKYSEIKTTVHRLYIEPSEKTENIPTGKNRFKHETKILNKCNSFDGKEIAYSWRVEAIYGISRQFELQGGMSEDELHPKVICYIGKGGLEFEDIIVPDNIETSVSDVFNRQFPCKQSYEEALKWRIAKRKWLEFVEPWLEKKRNAYKRHWPDSKEIPIGGHIEFQSILSRKYLPDHQIYIIETNFGCMSNLFAVSVDGKIFEINSNNFGSESGSGGTFKNKEFSDFIKQQEIVVNNENEALEAGKFIEELAFASNRWNFIKLNSNNFTTFKAWVFNQGTVYNPNWKWYTEKADSRWTISRRYVGPPASIMAPPQWILLLDNENKIVEVMR